MPPLAILTAGQTSALDKASKDAVSDIFQKNNDLINDRWLNPANSYLHSTTGRIRDDIKNGSLNEIDLGAYISVSAPLHCIDGWAYLSSAVNSLIHGDFNTARHLGYYAELRAAISILASEGIGIFGSDHYVIDINQRCLKIPGSLGTHKIVWPVLEYWAKHPSAAALIGSSVTPYGIKLEDWHRVFASSPTFPAIAENWLKNWGLDLQQLNSDHDTRNDVSYRPFRITQATPTMPVEVSEFVREFWTLFSPSGASKFDELDRYLLNKSLKAAYNALKGGKTYEDRVSFAVLNLFKDKQDAVRTSYEQFVLEDQDNLILRDANSSDPSSHPRHVFQMLSRASLLLRLATGASANLILSSGFSWHDFEFWWKGLGIDVGLWDTGNEPSSPDELWEDVKNSITEMNAWEQTVQDPTVFNMHDTNLNSKYLWTLSGTERIALWGLLR